MVNAVLHFGDMPQATTGFSIVVEIFGPERLRRALRGRHGGVAELRSRWRWKWCFRFGPNLLLSFCSGSRLRRAVQRLVDRVDELLPDVVRRVEEAESGAACAAAVLIVTSSE